MIADKNVRSIETSISISGTDRLAGLGICRDSISGQNAEMSRRQLVRRSKKQPAHQQRGAMLATPAEAREDKGPEV
jgi:hypothetical protein